MSAHHSCANVETANRQESPPTWCDCQHGRPELVSPQETSEMTDRAAEAA
jgi:hypothetical protein